MIKQKVSMKQKSILFVLLLISILLLTVYYQNRTANKNYLIQFETNYKKNFDNYYNLFNKHLIEFYESQTIHLQNNPNEKIYLIQNEKFLKDIHIVFFDQQKVMTKYVKAIQDGKSFINIQVLGKNIFYKVIVPLKNEKKGYIEYVLDSRVLLQSIKDFDGSNGILYVKDNDTIDDISLEEYKDSEFLQTMINKCKASQHEPVVKFDSNFYVQKELLLKDFKGEYVANAIFFLDFTKDKKAYKATIKESLLTTLVLFIFAAIVINYFFTYLIRRIEKNEKALRTINKNLEQMVEEETEKRLLIQEQAQKEKEERDQLLIQQSKLALLGEMIGNIAHQWRQPLMQLSAILMYLDAYNEKKKLTKERFETKIKEGNSIIDFMSKTIEDFRNYYKPEKQKELFFIKQSIDSALFIVHSSLKNYNINVNVHYDDEALQLESFKNEFSQALLNIISNAKDIIVLREIQNPQILIDVKKVNSEIIIHIQDNAGGIEESIVEKVFDPYFTTKHQAQGTGIGLYMTKMIIENNMNGKIMVENEKEGAKFTIVLKDN